jgi:hypothetical protein
MTDGNAGQGYDRRPPDCRYANAGDSEQYHAAAVKDDEECAYTALPRNAF